MASPFGELTVLVNPHAGRRHVGEEVPELERNLQSRGLAYRLVRTEGRGDATRLAREAAGSGSDFIRTFGLPGDVPRACQHLEGDNTYPLDVGKITYTSNGSSGTRLFANVAEAGLGAAVVARAERMSPRLGQSKYFFGFWLTLPRFKMATVTVRADRGSYEGPAYLIVVGNAQYNGGGMKVSPRSYPGDGVLDVLVFKGPKSDSFTMIPKVYRGEHVPHDHVEEFRVKRELVIEADRPLPIEADGEVLGTTPATFEVIPHPIRLNLCTGTRTG